MRNTLRLRPVITLISCSIILSTSAQNIGVSVDGATPNAKAVLDIDVSAAGLGTKRGMLIPRMTEAERLAIPVNVPSPAIGLWVYQTDDNATYSPATQHGYWYYDGTAWRRWSGGNGWQRPGTAAVGTEVLGTTTTEDLLMRSVFPYTVDPQVVIKGGTGYIGLNTPAAPVERLEINGGLRIYKAAPGPYSAGNQAGTIRFEDNAVPNKWHFGNIDGSANWRRMENAEVLVTSGGDYPKDTLICGAPGQTTLGTPMVHPGGLQYPPFGTGTTGRGYRVQYIYPGTELTGLCTGNITGFAFFMLQDECLACPPGMLNPCAINLQVRIATTAMTAFSAGLFWDNAVQAAVPVWTGVNITPGMGWFQFNFATPLFYTSGQNLVIDMTWERGTQAGISPRTDIQAVAGYNATRFGYHNSNPLTGPGSGFDDNPVTPGGLTVTNLPTRPITRFNAQVKFTGTTPSTANYIQYGGGLMVDSQLVANAWAATNYRGPGTVSARTAVYDGNLQLSDHVFDRYFEGTVRPEDEQGVTGYAYVGLPGLKNYLETERHLPNMPSRADWETNGKESLGELQTGLWETVETQALQIGELERDLKHLEELAFGEMSAAQVEQAIREINESPRLTEAQKLSLTTALRERKVVATPSNR